MELATRQIFVSRDTIFNESQFAFAQDVVEPYSQDHSFLEQPNYNVPSSEVNHANKEQDPNAGAQNIATEEESLMPQPATQK